MNKQKQDELLENMAQAAKILDEACTAMIDYPEGNDRSPAWLIEKTVHAACGEICSLYTKLLKGDDK